MKKTKITSTTKFYREVKLTKEDHKIHIICQPYATGIYVSLNDSHMSSSIQLGVEYKEYFKWIKDIIETHLKAKYEYTERMSEFGNFLDEEDIKFLNSDATTDS